MAMHTLDSYITERTRTLNPIHTTTTRSGQILDWIALASQDPAAAPPGPQMPKASSIHSIVARFELDRATEQRGPEGSVPILRPRTSADPETTDAVRYLSKPHAGSYALSAGADLQSGYFHASLDSESITYGAEMIFNVWDPTIEDTEDHSLMELWLVNTDGPVAQSVEVGWIVSDYQYGDRLPHLFTWFTTNGWGPAGDLVGGYDARQKGWVQVDATMFPGAVISDVSVANGIQSTIGVKVTLWNGDWWVAIQGRWIGYYPASLFQKERTGMTLANRANRVLFGGEVFSSNPAPLATTSQMGSGSAPSEGIGLACFVEQLRVQSGPEGTIEDFSEGTPIQEQPEIYSLESFLHGGGQRGSYMLVGGTGKGMTPSEVT
jgi:hypothetical protein